MSSTSPAPLTCHRPPRLYRLHSFDNLRFSVLPMAIPPPLSPSEIIFHSVRT